MKKLLLALLVSGASATAIGQTYLCLPEAIGGVIYQDGKWTGTSFVTDKKYLIKPLSKDNVELLQIKDPLEKFGWFNFEDEVALTTCKWDVGRPILRCDGFHYVMYNDETKKYLSFYKDGYMWGGKDEYKNTPSVTAGKCSKIN